MSGAQSSQVSSVGAAPVERCCDTDYARTCDVPSGAGAVGPETPGGAGEVLMQKHNHPPSANQPPPAGRKRIIAPLVFDNV